MKTYPKVGDKLYMSQRTGSYYVDLVKRPYTVVKVDKKNVYVQAARCIFDPKDNYYNSLPIDIVEDKTSEIIKLNWAYKKERWQYDDLHTGYPEIAFFGAWEYYPYLD